ASDGQTWSGALTLKTLTTVGSYAVTENPFPGYGATFSADCSGTIAVGQVKICSITNYDLPAYLRIYKVVVNDNGGTATADAFSGTITGVTAAGGQTWS